MVRLVAPVLWISFGLPCLAAPAAAQSPAERKAPDAADLVKVQLIADVTRVTPGKKLTVAARFDIAPGWHIYWENPGEAGLATEVGFAAPPGFALTPVRFPGPIRFQTPGETAASYGYSEGLLLLSSQVTAPASAAREPARFSIQASWLVCRDVCLRGQGSASLDLPPASKAEPSRPANADLFSRHRAALPRPFAELRATSRWERDPRGAHLVVGGLKAADKVEYFPPTREDLQLVGQAAAAGKSGTTELRLTYKPGFKPARARGVLAVTRGPVRRYYAVDLEEVP